MTERLLRAHVSLACEDWIIMISLNSEVQFLGERHRNITIILSIIMSW
jgi:hypothetical protein